MTLFDASARAMSAQLVRMNAAASNMANAGTVAASPQTAYRALRPVFASVLDTTRVFISRTRRRCASMIRTIRWLMPTAIPGHQASMKTPK